MKHWPQAAGPHGNWHTDGKPLTRWSVARAENVRWRTPLPEAGQSGIAVWGDRLFLTTLAPLAPENKARETGDIVGHCVDRKTGALLWSVPLPAAEPSPYAYGFSDASSPTPVTDGKRVWFTNASGRIACCDLRGKVLWQRTWKPTTGRPFNKQYEPILHNGVLLSVEPRDESDPRREKDPWNWLRALDAATGKTLWLAEDAITHYNTPVFGKLGREACVLQGRGGYHDVPEMPVGMSLTRLSDGKTLWRYAAGGKAQYNLHWDERYAYWFDQDTSTHTTLDSKTGKVLRTVALDQNAIWRRWEGGGYRVEKQVDFKARKIKVFPAWFTNIIVGDWHWFLCFSNPEPAYGQGPTGPLYCVGRVHRESGAVEYLELPTAPDGVYRKPVGAGTKNSRGVEVAQDPRSNRDGWHWVFLGSPIAVSGTIYWTLQNGITYVVDGNAATLDINALVAVNDLGPLGATWSLNTPTFADGKLYHRTMKELVCLG